MNIPAITLPKFLTPQPKKSFVLIVGDDGAMLATHGVRGAAGLFTPKFDDPATQKIIEVLKRNARAKVALLLDVLEQNYRRESVPKVNYFDRAKVLRRRLELAFPISPLRGTAPLPADKENPRLQNFMFVGAADSEEINKWIALLGQLSNPIGGIAPLPLESAELPTLLAPGRPQDDKQHAPFITLVTWHRTGGFRQIVVRGGELVFTRMTPSLDPQADGPDLALNLEREFRATLGYLGRLGFGEGHVLQVVTVFPERAREAVGRMKIAGYAPHFLTPAEAARKLGIPGAVANDEQYGDLLHGAWFARKVRPLISLLPAALAQRQQVEEAGTWIKRASGALYVGAALYAAWLVFTLVLSQMELADLEEQVLANRQLVIVEGERLKRFPAALPLVSGTLEIEKQLSARTTTPWALLERVAPALGNDMRLASLVWLVPPPPLPTAGAPAQPVPPGGKVITPIRLEFSALIVAPDATRESAVQSTRDLLARLSAALPDHNVAVTRYPVNILPGQSLTNTAESEDMPFGARFGAGFSITGPRR